MRFVFGQHLSRPGIHMFVMSAARMCIILRNAANNQLAVGKRQLAKAVGSETEDRRQKTEDRRQKTEAVNAISALTTQDPAPSLPAVALAKAGTQHPAPSTQHPATCNLTLTPKYHILQIINFIICLP